MVSLSAILFTLLASQPIFAFDPSGFEGGVYWKRLMNAFEEVDLDRADSMLKNPPIGVDRPLAEADGRLLFVAGQVLVAQNDPVYIEKILKLIERSIDLGANPRRFIPARNNLDQEPTSDPRNSVIDVFLNAWIKINDQTDHRHANFEKMYELFYNKGVLFFDYQSLILFSATNMRRMPITHWLIAANAHPRMMKYFFNKIPIDTLDQQGVTATGFAAGSGDVAYLRKIAQALGPDLTLKAFNTISPARYQPTNMHFAIYGVSRGRTIEQTLETMDYLAQNGANPDQRSVYHDLLQECHYAASLFPQFQADYAHLRERIELRLPLWRELSARARGGVNCEKLASPPRSSKTP